MPRLTFTNVLGSDVSIGNPDGYGKSFTIPAGGLTVDMTGAQMESIGPELQLMKTKGYITWVKTDNPAISDDLELGAGVPSRMVAFQTASVAAKSATGVHAAVFGDAVGPVTVTTALTNPVVPRNVSTTAGATYDGGIVTIHGTNQFDAVQVETITPVAGLTTAGVKIWKTVTSFGYPGGGVGTHGTNTLSIGTHDKVGIVGNIFDTSGALFVAGASEAVTIDATVDGFSPTTTPAGTVYTLLANVVE